MKRLTALNWSLIRGAFLPFRPTPSEQQMKKVEQTTHPEAGKDTKLSSSKTQEK